MYPRMEVTPELVRGLWNYLSKEIGSQISRKSSSSFMKLSSKILEAINIISREEFMKNTATTIFDHIFVPFKIGDSEDSWSLYTQLSTAIHEHHHVHQFKTEGRVRFVSSYLLTKSGRAHWEAEAYRCDVELFYWMFGVFPNLDYTANRLKESYGRGDNEVTYVRTFLEMSKNVIEEGQPISPVTERALHWLEENGKWQ